MSFVEKGVPAPDIQEGQVLKARVVSIRKVDSKWKDDQGSPRQQLEFNLELENGYKARSWMGFYERPSDKSKLGKLVMKFAETTKKQLDNIDQFLAALKEWGYVFVRCSGFREYEEELLPNFSIVTDKIPVPPEKKEKTAPAVAKEKPAEADHIAYLKTVILEAMKPSEVYPKAKLVEFGKVGDFGDVEIEKAINTLLEDGKIRPKFEALNLVGFFKGSLGNQQICDNCGRAVDVRTFVPPLVRGSLISTFQRGKWVCKNCLSEMKEKK